MYAFWHFDDFSWGETRIVAGDTGKGHDHSKKDGEFDTTGIHLKRWVEWLRELRARERQEQEYARMILQQQQQFQSALDFNEYLYATTSSSSQQTHPFQQQQQQQVLPPPPPPLTSSSSSELSSMPSPIGLVPVAVPVSVPFQGPDGIIQTRQVLFPTGIDPAYAPVPVMSMMETTDSTSHNTLLYQNQDEFNSTYDVFIDGLELPSRTASTSPALPNALPHFDTSSQLTLNDTAMMSSPHLQQQQQLQEQQMMGMEDERNYIEGNGMTIHITDQDDFEDTQLYMRCESLPTSSSDMAMMMMNSVSSPDPTISPNTMIEETPWNGLDMTSATSSAQPRKPFRSGGGKGSGHEYKKKNRLDPQRTSSLNGYHDPSSMEVLTTHHNMNNVNDLNDGKNMDDPVPGRSHSITPTHHHYHKHHRRHHYHKHRHHNVAKFDAMKRPVVEGKNQG